MRYALLAVFVACLPSLRSFSQVPSIVEGTTFETRPGQWRRVIRNQSPSSLVAFRVPCDGPSGGMITLHDALLYTANHFVQPGASIEVAVADPSRCNGHVEAAIFSDGHVEGDPGVAYRELFSSRRGAYKALKYSIQLLSSAQSEHVPIEHVIDTLEAKRQSSFQERTVGHVGFNFILDVVLDTLRQPQVSIYVPSDDYGPKHRQPSIEDVMNANGVSRDEA